MRWACSIASLSNLRFSTHSARVAQTRFVATRLPIAVIFSQTISLGSPFWGFGAVCESAGAAKPAAATMLRKVPNARMAVSLSREMER